MLCSCVFFPLVFLILAFFAQTLALHTYLCTSKYLFGAEWVAATLAFLRRGSLVFLHRRLGACAVCHACIVHVPCVVRDVFSLEKNNHVVRLV